MDIDISEDEDQARLLIDGYLREQLKISKQESFIDIAKLIQLFYYIPGIININSPTPTPEPMIIDDKNNSNDTDNHDPIKCKNINKLLQTIEPSIVLVDGYIRELTKATNICISEVITDLIQSFYQKMKGTTFVWEITDEKKLLTKILESNKLTNNNNNNNSKGFDSDVFETVTPLKQPLSDMPICANCGKVSNNLKRCSGCKQVYYCSRNCQYNHWDTQHGNVCAPGPPPLLDYSNSNNANNIQSIFDDYSEKQGEKLDNLSLKWYIKLYESLGQIELELILVSLPSILESVSFIYQIYCHELSLYWSSQIEFNNDETRHCLSESVNGNASISLLNDLQILKEMGKLNKLTFYSTFNIIRCGMKNTNINSSRVRGYKYKYNPIYYFDEKKYLKSIGIGMNNIKNDIAIDIDKQLSDFLMENNKFKFKWDINEDIISNLTSSINIDHPKCVISDLYFNQWCLSLIHRKINVSKKGIQNVSVINNEEKDEEKDDNKHDNNNDEKKEDNNNKQQMNDLITIGLELVALPSNISSFVAQIKLFCLQFSSQWSIVKKFSYNNRYYNDLIINNISLPHMNKLSIFVDIKIIEVFDEYGDEQQIKIKQIKQKYKQQIIKNYKPIDTFNINWNEKIIGDLNMRYHFKHICISNNNLTQISSEELRFEDENSPKWANIKYTNNINNLNINGMQSSLIYNKPSNYYINNKKRGTVGYNFIPFIQKNNHKKHSKKYKIFYYQHILINDYLNNQFEDKQNEELQCEDKYNNEYQINNNNNNNNNSWDKLFGTQNNNNNNQWSWNGNNNNENNNEINLNDSKSNTPNTEKNISPIGSPGTKIMNGKNPYQLCHESINGDTENNNNNNNNKYLRGSLVQINGLRGTIAKYNGKKAKILSFDETKNKYKIKLLNSVNDKKRNHLHLKKNNLLMIKENKIIGNKINDNKEKNLKEFKTDWKFNTKSEWIWDKNDQKDNELLNVKIMKNKIDFITNKLEKMTDIICKMYDCKIIKDDDDENKNEINKMFDELKNMNDINNIENNNENNNENNKQIELKNWLENELGLIEYYQLFIDEGIDDLDTLKLVNYEQLKEIGIKKLGHRLKILQKVKETFQ